MTDRSRPCGIRRWIRPALLTGWIAVASLVACDDDPRRGSGTLVARIHAPTVELGSATLEIRGSGIRGVEGAGDARVFARAQTDGSWRVVVVDPGGGELLFRIRVDDVADPLPSAVVTSAADTANAVVPSGVSTTVGLER